jgi:hypothetical protein
VRTTYEAAFNHQTNHDKSVRNEEDDSLNHAVEIIENLLQETR